MDDALLIAGLSAWCTFKGFSLVREKHGMTFLPHMSRAVWKDGVKKQLRKQRLGLGMKRTAETCWCTFKITRSQCMCTRSQPTPKDHINWNQNLWTDEHREADVNTHTVSARLPRAGFTAWQPGYYHNLHTGKWALICQSQLQSVDSTMNS